MSWWTTALYDTCSIITLDKLLRDRPSLSRHFPKRVLALERCFSADQMRAETAKRIRGRTEFAPLPPVEELVNVLSCAALPKALCEVDTLVFATAVHCKLAVVTGDKRLAGAVNQRRLRVGNVALILRELVESGKLTSTTGEKLLQELAERGDRLPEC